MKVTQHLGLSGRVLVLCGLVVLAGCRAEADDAVGRALRQAAESLYRAGGGAVKHGARAVELARRRSDPELQLRALVVQARALTEAASFARAAAVLDLASKQVDEHGLLSRGPVELARAHLAFRRGLRPSALVHVGRALDTLGVEATPRHRAEIHYLRGICAAATGTVSKGIADLYLALSLSVQHGFPDVETNIHLGLAKLCVDQRSFAASKEHALRAETLARKHRLDLQIPSGILIRGHAELLKFKPETCEPLYREALELARQQGNSLAIADGVRAQAHLARVFEKDAAKALELYRESLAMVKQIGDLERTAYTMANIASVLRVGGQHEEVLALIAEHGEVCSLVDQPRLRVSVNRIRGQTYAALGEYQRAYEALWIAADTDRWLGPEESTAEMTRRDLVAQHSVREQSSQRITMMWFGIAIAGALMSVLLLRLRSNQRRTHAAQLVTNLELAEALSQVKQLRGMLPICAKCKSIRDDSGFWQRIETYITTHSEAVLSHGLCPDCAEELYPGLL